MKKNRDADTLRLISIGDKSLQNLQVSPDGRFITYRLFQPPSGAKQTIVPDYVTESGYTTDLNVRTKVGAPLGRYEFFVLDQQTGKLISLNMDSLPGITDLPDYAKDYPARYANKKPQPRPVFVNGPYWNNAGTIAIVDIRSQDNKDRWIMQLDPLLGKLNLIDRQRDEAWIGGPGISAFNPRMGWIDESSFYFQSEATGYSHLYVHQFTTSKVGTSKVPPANSSKPLATNSRTSKVPFLEVGPWRQV